MNSLKAKGLFDADAQVRPPLRTSWCLRPGKALGLGGSMIFLNSVTRIIYLVIIALLATQSVAQQGSQGTGVFINPDGHVVTNRHVVEHGCRSGLWVEDIAGKRFRAEIANVSHTHDLALLQSRRQGPHAFFRVNNTRDAAVLPVLGEKVHIVGFPGGEFAFRGGLVSTLQDPRHGRTGFGVGLQTTFGGSGSPVFDDSGLLIGIVWGVRRSEDGSLRAHSVRADAIFPLLSEVRVGTATSQQAPHPPKQGQAWLDHAQDIVGTGAAITVKVYCIEG